MSISLDHSTATSILLEVAQRPSPPDSEIGARWVPKLRELSKLCPARKSATVHAAFGTATLAKCVDQRIDVFSLLDRDGGSGAYSARSLADNVLARHRSDLDLDLGANGPNPLNNTPFIGKKSIRDISGVRNSRGWSYFIALLSELQSASSADAREILAAFLHVRRRSILAPVELDPGAGEHLTPHALAELLELWVALDSESGRRAQACAAGLVDCIHGVEFVQVGGINDPDRNAPLDIAVRDNAGGYPLAYEVKDKAVTANFVQMSIEKAKAKFDVPSVVFVAVAPKQAALDEQHLVEWALVRGVNLSFVFHWDALVSAASLYFAQGGSFAGAVLERVLDRCREVGVSGDGVELLLALLDHSAVLARLGR